MGKITFRADDDLVDELEAFDASKSEVMRSALRTYLERQRDETGGRATETVEDDRIDDADAAGPETNDGAQTLDLEGGIDELVADRLEDVVDDYVDELVRARMEDLLADDRPVADGPSGDRSADESRDPDRAQSEGRSTPASTQEATDVNVTITLDGVEAGVDATADQATNTPDAGANGRREGDPRQQRLPSDGTGVSDTRGRPSDPSRAMSDDVDNATRPCSQCGTAVDGDHVHCPNCGEKVSRRVFCECGDEVRSDWSFCPGCGRRTPAADVLDSR